MNVKYEPVGWLDQSQAWLAMRPFPTPLAQGNGILFDYMITLAVSRLFWQLKLLDRAAV